MNIKDIIYIIFIVAVLAGCKKKLLPDPTEGAPVFRVAGKMAGQDLELIAGKEDYYMFSEVEQDASGVYVFSGTLSKSSCTSCPSTLEFLIRDYKVSAQGTPVIPANSLPAGFYSYQSPGSSANSFQFLSQPFGTGTLTFDWDFGDGATSSLANPSHEYTTPGIYTVCLVISSNTGCADSICNVIEVGNPAQNTVSTFTMIPQPGTSAIKFVPQV